jgi:hypothetical protein
LNNVIKNKTIKIWGATNLEFDMLSNTEASSLEDLFQENEVWEVIKGMDRDKAPDSDGFSMAFFKEC